MENKHWLQFYKEDKAPKKHSDFAGAVESFFIDERGYRDLTMFDLGAGNGRDAGWLNESSFFKVTGFDKNYNNILNNVYKKSLKQVIKQFYCPEIVYSRFFLHSITNKEIVSIIKWTQVFFIAEFRIKGDKPKLYTDHKRNLIDLGWLVNKLLDNNFRILKLEVGKGLAKYKNEDPLVARVYARRFKK